MCSHCSEGGCHGAGSGPGSGPGENGSYYYNLNLKSWVCSFEGEGEQIMMPLAVGPGRPGKTRWGLNLKLHWQLESPT